MPVDVVEPMTIARHACTAEQHKVQRAFAVCRTIFHGAANEASLQFGFALHSF
jgi:hypothetical protein